MRPAYIFGGDTDPDFLTAMSAQLRDVLSICGLRRMVDISSQPRSESPLASMFSLNEDAAADLKSAVWDDKPLIEKILHVMIKSTSKPKGPPEAITARILAHLPGTCSVAVMIAYSFTPIEPTSDMDLSKVGRWTLSMRDVGGLVQGQATRNWQGDVLDRQELQDAMDGVAAACGRYRDKYRLKPIPTGMDAYVSAPAYTGAFPMGALGVGQEWQPIAPQAEPPAPFQVGTSEDMQPHDGPQG